MVLALLTACGPVAWAPADLDGLAHWLWFQYETADDVELAVAVERLHGVLDPAALEGPQVGRLTDLTPEEQATVVIDPPQDPAAATGMYVLDVLPCTLDQAEALLTESDQGRRYADVYDAYARTYTSDLASFEAGDAPFVTWEATVSAAVLGNDYVAEVDAGLRRSPAQAAAPFGPILLSRAHLPRPASFEDPGAAFNQDHQLEVYYEQSPGSLVHGWFLWREIDAGWGLDTDNENIVALMLSKLAEWDNRTAEICAAGF